MVEKKIAKQKCELCGWKLFLLTQDFNLQGPPPQKSIHLEK